LYIREAISGPLHFNLADSLTTSEHGSVTMTSCSSSFNPAGHSFRGRGLHPQEIFLMSLISVGLLTSVGYICLT